ncbi:hypothetical protein C8R44DRAFT_815075 [Mycena epipterygia]|nr:hypothetical protein C8R44DRAFT_815075 [Mycena epipterygia]
MAGCWRKLGLNLSLENPSHLPFFSPHQRVWCPRFPCCFDQCGSPQFRGVSVCNRTPLPAQVKHTIMLIGH